ncbi:MAG TPA: hypothetical protein PLI11_07160 [Clostridia bacterium]|jgi:hypothetical protein|nr:hypothetical protein [Clostridia bacterium]
MFNDVKCVMTHVRGTKIAQVYTLSNISLHAYCFALGISFAPRACPTMTATAAPMENRTTFASGKQLC